MVRAFRRLANSANMATAHPPDLVISDVSEAEELESQAEISALIIANGFDLRSSLYASSPDGQDPYWTPNIGYRGIPSDRVMLTNNIRQPSHQHPAETFSPQQRCSCLPTGLSPSEEGSFDSLHGKKLHEFSSGGDGIGASSSTSTGPIRPRLVKDNSPAVGYLNTNMPQVFSPVQSDINSQYALNSLEFLQPYFGTGQFSNTSSSDGRYSPASDDSWVHVSSEDSIGINQTVDPEDVRTPNSKQQIRPRCALNEIERIPETQIHSAIRDLPNYQREHVPKSPIIAWSQSQYAPNPTFGVAPRSGTTDTECFDHESPWTPVSDSWNDEDINPTFKEISCVPCQIKRIPVSTFLIYSPYP